MTNTVLLNMSWWVALIPLFEKYYLFFFQSLYRDLLRRRETVLYKYKHMYLIITFYHWLFAQVVKDKLQNKPWTFK